MHSWSTQWEGIANKRREILKISSAHTHSRQIHAAQWFIVMNYLVHGVMYTYYAVRASGYYRPPVWVNMFITLLQLLQMVVGVAINSHVCYQMTTDKDWYCDGKIETTYIYVYWSFAMYFSYLVLFAQFFYTTYLTKPTKSKVQHEKIGMPVSQHKFQPPELLNGRVYMTNGHPGSTDPRKRMMTRN